MNHFILSFILLSAIIAAGCNGGGSGSHDGQAGPPQSESPSSTPVSPRPSDGSTQPTPSTPSVTSHAAGIQVKMETFGSHPEIIYRWVSLGLHPLLYPDSVQWWDNNHRNIKSRNATAQIISYHSGSIINDLFIPDYNLFSNYVGGAVWSNSFYLRDGSGLLIPFQNNLPNRYYIDISNPAARKYIASVAAGMMKYYADAAGGNLDGIYFDYVEWKPRAQARPYLSDQTYRSSMTSIINDVRTIIRTYNPSAEVSGNAGAVRDHGDFSLLNQLDTVFSENTFGLAFSGHSDDEITLAAFMNQNSRRLIIGIDGDYLGWGQFAVELCPSDDRFQRAKSFAQRYEGRVLIAADYGPASHGNLNCWRSEYLIW